MIRTPLRPLARILPARAKGEDPGSIERENLRLRHEEMQTRARQRAESRLLVTALAFFAVFAVIGIRMAMLATTEPTEPRATAEGTTSIAAQRADIVDRRGRILATNFDTYSLYAQPRQMVDPVAVVAGLTRIFPDLDGARLLKDFTGKRTFVWIKKKISPEQKQAVYDLGDPGLLFGPREMRLYPNGRLAAHVLGGATFGKEGVSAAEVIGVAGVEKKFDDYLRDPANGNRPLQLSLDLTIQDAVERVLLGGMKLMNAKYASAILMDVKTGEVIALVSLPDFDPNDRPRPPLKGDPSDSPLFNRAVQGLYELGSVFKIFVVAQALDIGLIRPETKIDIRGPLRFGSFRIKDFKNYGNELSAAKVIIKSSNIGAARIAMEIGGTRQQQFLAALGIFDPTPLELVESAAGEPLLPTEWTELTTVTASYGHGFSTSLMNLAAGYAAIANGGRYVSPTILKQDGPQYGPRVMSPEAAAQARIMLRRVVTEGTASLGEVPGYRVGGKTGTADKLKPSGGYYKDKVISTFASMFPIDDPAYVLVVSLDEPQIQALGEIRRTAGWTAVPIAAELIGRIAPLLGLRPDVEPGAAAAITRTSQSVAGRQGATNGSGVDMGGTDRVSGARTLSRLGLTARGGRNPAITRLAVDSRQVVKGALFAALPGVRVHGGEFIEYALRMGAAAILTDAAGARIAAAELAASDAALVVAEDPRQALALSAALWFGAQPETMVAITGTNGKTSVASFLRQIWVLRGHAAVNLGTTGVEGAWSAPLDHTTPEPITLHRILAEAADNGITHAAMEASSHGLAQRRLDGVRLRAAGFTNLGRDHLDYHTDSDDYFAAKARLFRCVLPEGGVAAINLDDPRGDEMRAIAAARGQRVISVGRGIGDFCLLGQRFDATGQELRFTWQGQAHQTRLNLIGGFQAENVGLACALAIACGEAPERVFETLPELVTVRGRMQLAATRANGAAVFVDFAHTPEAIATALKAMRPHVMGRLVAIIGAGGDRDRAKRPLMGRAAVENADLVFITDDNPRGEDPGAIRAAVLEGAPGAVEVADRAEAILRGVDALGPGDALLIAGKGHESGQIVGDDVLPFDDTEQASVSVAALDGGGA